MGAFSDGLRKIVMEAALIERSHDHVEEEINDSIRQLKDIVFIWKAYKNA